MKLVREGGREKRMKLEGGGDEEGVNLEREGGGEGGKDEIREGGRKEGRKKYCLKRYVLRLVLKAGREGL